MTNCDAHYHDPEIGYCINCIKRWLDQRNKLLEFVKELSKHWLSEQDIYYKTIHEYDNCDYLLAQNCRDLLEEIGES